MGIPFTGTQLTFHYPGTILSSLLYLGLGTASYFVGKSVYRLAKSLYTSFISVNNSLKYLYPKQSEGKEDKTHSVVIYGANTKVGKSYAYFLARQGFHLILVEREAQSLNTLQAELKAHFLEEPSITKIVLDKFDVDTFNKQVVQKLKNLDAPVKLFINCKNSRRKILSE